MKSWIRALFTVFIFIWGPISIFGQLSIEEARHEPPGSVVTLEGVLMDDGSFAPNRYLQDSTAAIMLYLPPEEEEELLEYPRASRVRLSGTIDFFQDQVELVDVFSVQLIDSNVALFPPLRRNLNTWSDSLSARYIELPAFRFLFPGLPLTEGSFAIHWRNERAILDFQGSNLSIDTDPSAYTLRGFLQMDEEHFLFRTTESPVETTTSPYRSNMSITNLEEHSVTVQWTSTGYTKDSVLLYKGDNSVPERRRADSDSLHNVTFDGLEASAAYSIGIRSRVVGAPDTLRFRTPDGLPDEVEFYFNYPVDTSIATQFTPDGISGLAAEQALIERIDAAQEQIDFCMYNNSRIDIVRALKRAHNRGVQVRYVTDDQTTNWALLQTSVPFEVVDGNIGDGLMHNKFISIDPDRPENAWLITGAMNFTTGQIATDYNHLIFLKEQSLALTYETEFEEMWGGEEAQPDPSNARFGAGKSANTSVHHTFLNDRVEVYFAPTDDVSDQIRRTMAAADHSIDFALLLMTQNELGTTLVRSEEEGLNVRGIMENAFGPGSEFSYMRRNNVEVYEDIHPSAIFHHKYALVDEGKERPRLLTGSYNWSYSAETIHDENYLITHHPGIANVFAQDFEERFCEIVDCTTAVDEANTGDGLTVFPNPASDQLQVELPESWNEEELTIKWFHSDGRLMQVRMGAYHKSRLTVDVTHWTPGIYWMQVSLDGQSKSIPVLVQR